VYIAIHILMNLIFDLCMPHAVSQWIQKIQVVRVTIQQSHNRVTQRSLPNDAKAPVNHSEHYETAEKAKKRKSTPLL
jgi:hypothetical protein